MMKTLLLAGLLMTVGLLAAQPVEASQVLVCAGNCYQFYGPPLPLIPSGCREQTAGGIVNVYFLLCN